MAYRWELTNADGETKFPIVPKKKREKKKKNNRETKKRKKKREQIYLFRFRFWEWKTLIDIMFNFVDERSNRWTHVYSIVYKPQFFVTANKSNVSFYFFFLPLLLSLSLFLPSIFARNASERLFINAIDRLLIRHVKFLKAFLPTGFELPDFLCLLRGTYSTRGIFHSYSFIRLKCIRGWSIF